MSRIDEIRSELELATEKGKMAMDVEYLLHELDNANARVERLVEAVNGIVNHFYDVETKNHIPHKDGDCDLIIEGEEIIIDKLKQAIADAKGENR